MSDKTPDLLIRSPTRRNKLFSLLCGGLLCVISTVVAFWWPKLELLILLGYLSGVLLIFVGILKYSEPVHSLSLTKQTLSYVHRYGGWSIRWHDVMLVSHPSVSIGLERCYIPYIGIKLRNVTGVAHSVSPRLASRQIHEQRDILMLAHQQELLSLEQITINFSDFTLDNNESINGPRAAWLHQTQALRSAYGCDLYVPITSFTQSPQQMVAILNKYRLAAVCDRYP
jgi:hypothetical protein